MACANDRSRIRTCGRSTLAKCLESLTNQTKGPEEIAIVQASASNQIHKTSDESRPVVVRQKGRSISNAANEGVSVASGDVVAFIDDDAQASPNWIETLRKPYVANHSIVGVGPVNDFRTGRPWFHRGVIDIFGINYMRGEKVKSSLPTLCYLTGCNMSFQVRILNEIGGFDEFYMYSHEDADVCVRVQQAGHTIVFEESAIVWHHYAPGPTRRHLAYNFERSRVYFSPSNPLSNFPLVRFVISTFISKKN